MGKRNRNRGNRSISTHAETSADVQAPKKGLSVGGMSTLIKE